MRYLSVCSGIEAASAAWHDLGWTPLAFSEIEPFPRAVLAHRFPTVPLHGDFTKIRGDEHGAVDLLVGGTPCQSFSIAGLRGGLDDDRGNLALEFLRLAQRTRARWLVWENVPGVLSSNGGRDFGAILGGMVELGYGFAYRVLDAQHFGVAQRRRRVFVVGYLGDWRSAAAVLFERASLSGHPAPRRETGQRPAFSFAARTRGGGGLGTDTELDGGLIADARWPAEIAPTLNAAFGEKQGLEDQHALGGAGLFVAHALRAEGFDASEDGTGRGTPLVPVHAFDARQSDVVQYGDRAGPRDTCGFSQAVAFAQNTRDEVRLQGGDGDIVGALAAEPGMKQTTYVAFDTMQITSAANRTRAEPGLPASTISARSQMHVATPMAVRRLTPRECERLQGFPDDWTMIPWRGRPADECPDGPRYKSLGNSMAVPVMRWIGRRIAEVGS